MKKNSQPINTIASLLAIDTESIQLKSCTWREIGHGGR